MPWLVKHCVAVFTLLGLGLSPAIASLVPGDIALLQINDSGTATGSLVKWAPLVDLPGGTVVTFTDRSWVNGPALFGTLSSEGEVTFTTPSNIAAGTIFTLTLNAPASVTLTRDRDTASFNSNIAVTGWTGSFTLTSAGDNFFIFTGADVSPNFIFGTLFTTVTVNRDPNTGWSTDTPATTTSLLPASLTNGVTAISLNYTTSGARYMAYTGATNAATRATWLARFVTATNWTGAGSAVAGSFGTTLAFLSATPPPGITSAATANAIYGHAFNYTIAASNSPTSFGASGLPTGLTVAPATGVITGQPTQSGTYLATISATNSTGYGTATLTITVAKANLTVSGVAVDDKVYDGTTNATLNLAGATLNGVVNGDSLSLDATGAIAAFANHDAGTHKTVTVTGLELAGIAATNYTLTQPSVTGNITPAPVTILLNRSVQLYTGGAKTVPFSTIPANVAIFVTYNGNNVPPSDAGAYTVIGTSLDSNYSGSATNRLYIAEAPQFTTVSTNANNIVFTWSTLPEVNYQVVTAPALAPFSWVNFNGQVTATNTTMTMTDVIDRNQISKFYWVQLILE